MGRIELNKRRILSLVVAIAVFLVLYNALSLSGSSVSDRLAHIPVPGRLTPSKHTGEVSEADGSWDYPPPSEPASPGDAAPVPVDRHPIGRLMQEADKKWRIYEGSRSMTFRQTVEKYRSNYGRHPPPGFTEWYKFARRKNVFNVDDFDQIMDDLRPFWAIDPATIRTYAAHLWENPNDGVAGIHIRNKEIVRVDNGSWRSETMEEVIKKFVEHLPDMDIAMNRLDQPRLVVPWEEMQALLQKESETRVMLPDASDSFTTGQAGLFDVTIEEGDSDNSTRLDAEWFSAPGQQYMIIASQACPPESPARSNMSVEEADMRYKEPVGGFINNFNLSSDLCTVGPAIQDLHGMLYSASSIIASHKLVPIFGECKVNVNNDILFPANMYYRHDERYDYNADEDVDWREKMDSMIWRGVTSGGVQIAENWQRMHRQRLVQLFNGTWMSKAANVVTVLTQDREQSASQGNITYDLYDQFQPSQVADLHSDVGFVEAWGCVPDCSFYDTVFSWKAQTALTSQFKYKYLIDVDGHSFSGRWHAFLQSKSLGLKATIFREWHDSRLFAWRHFVPVDNRYDDLYALLTYFIGYGKPNMEHALESEDLNPQVYIAAHQKEAQTIARQSREWANKVLRRDDIEVYMFRLLLEYGRVIDDNRDHIGYSGDGSELDKFDAGEEGLGGWGIPSSWWSGDSATV